MASASNQPSGGWDLNLSDEEEEHNNIEEENNNFANLFNTNTNGKIYIYYVHVYIHTRFYKIHIFLNY